MNEPMGCSMALIWGIVIAVILPGLSVAAYLAFLGDAHGH